MQHSARVWIESYDSGNRSSGLCSLDNGTYDQLMAKVQPVKYTECQYRRPVDVRVVSSVKESHKKLVSEFALISYFSLVDSTLKCNLRSANGANCNSQGQVLSAAKHVAPGTMGKQSVRALKVRTESMANALCRSFRAYPPCVAPSRGDALRCAQRLPLAITFPRLQRSRINQFHNSILLHFEVESANDK
jgi:hypothetical protein